MSVEDMERRDWAVLWLATGIDDKGRTTVSAQPQEIKVRWNDVQQLGSDVNGDPVTISAKVVVQRTLIVPIGSRLWKGRLIDMPGTSETPEADVMKVVTVTNTQDVKGKKVRRELSLTRSRDTLPSFTT